MTATRAERLAAEREAAQEALEERLERHRADCAEAVAAGAAEYLGDYNARERGIPIYDCATSRRVGLVSGSTQEVAEARVADVMGERLAIAEQLEQAEVDAAATVAALNDSARAAHLALLNGSARTNTGTSNPNRGSANSASAGGGSTSQAGQQGSQGEN